MISCNRLAECTSKLSLFHPLILVFLDSCFLFEWWVWCRSHVLWIIFNLPPGCILIRELFGACVPSSYFHVRARAKCLISLQPLAAKGSGTACMHNCASQIGSYIHSCLVPPLRMTARKNELGKSLQSKDTASYTNFFSKEWKRLDFELQHVFPKNGCTWSECAPFRAVNKI